MHRAAIVLILAIFSLSSTYADTEFEGSVPLALVKAFLGNAPYGEVALYSDMNSAFPEFEIPDGFTIFGSLDRGYSIAVVLTTELANDQAVTALKSSFSQAGFTDFEVPGSRDPDTGFINPNRPRPQFYNRLCHDSYGFISISYAEQDDLNLVTLSSNRPNNNQSCAEQFAVQARGMSMRAASGAGLRQFLPRMELPASEQRRYSPFSGMGSSSSGSAVESRANLNIDWEIEEIFRHLKQQIEDQGWQLDSENAGTSSAAGNWTRSPEPGTDLIGTLTVLKTDEEAFELKFQLISTGATNNNSGFGVFRAN